MHSLLIDFVSVYVDVVHILICGGIDTSLRDTDGRTALEEVEGTLRDRDLDEEQRGMFDRIVDALRRAESTGE